MTHDDLVDEIRRRFEARLDAVPPNETDGVVFKDIARPDEDHYVLRVELQGDYGRTIYWADVNKVAQLIERENDLEDLVSSKLGPVVEKLNVPEPSKGKLVTTIKETDSE